MALRKLKTEAPSLPSSPSSVELKSCHLHSSASCDRPAGECRSGSLEPTLSIHAEQRTKLGGLRYFVVQATPPARSSTARRQPKVTESFYLRLP
jgi:hypothetical protein